MEKYLLIGSMNPSIDVTMTVESFRTGGTNRALDVREDAGGKGINVARALRQLGVEQVICTGLLWETGGELLRGALEADGVFCDFVTLPGAVRRNIKVRDAEKGEITEINAQSPVVSAGDLVRAEETFLRLAKNASGLVLTGSLPKGCGADFYARLIATCRVPCALDADGEALRMGVRAHPAIVKCNEKELAVLAGEGDVLSRAKSVVDGGVPVVIASLGAQGSILATVHGAWRAHPLQLAVRSTVGAGDAMLSGYLAAQAQGLAPVECFRHAVASASASVEGEGTSIPCKEDLAIYWQKIKIERMVEW